MQLSSRDNLGRYIAASRDGELRFFNTQLDLQLSCRAEGPSEQAATSTSAGVWVTDIVCMLNVGVLAVACTPGFIALYSAVAIGLVRPIVIIDKLEICASSIDYWSAVSSCLFMCHLHIHMAALRLALCPYLCMYMFTLILRPHSL